MRKYWWKILAVILLVYTFIAGFFIKVPDIGNLKETIRNLFFHVPMWFGQIILLTTSLVYSIKYLLNIGITAAEIAPKIKIKATKSGTVKAA